MDRLSPAITLFASLVGSTGFAADVGIHHVVHLRGAVRSGCNAAVDDGGFFKVEQLSVALKGRNVRSDKDTVTLSGDLDTPWRCVGQAMTILARSGYKGKVGFIAEPPSAHQ